MNDQLALKSPAISGGGTADSIAPEHGGAHGSSRTRRRPCASDSAGDLGPARKTRTRIEGRVNRLEPLERRSHDRADFDPPRRRVLLAARSARTAREPRRRTPSPRGATVPSRAHPDPEPPQGTSGTTGGTGSTGRSPPRTPPCSAAPPKLGLAFRHGRPLRPIAPPHPRTLAGTSRRRMDHEAAAPARARTLVGKRSG